MRRLLIDTDTAADDPVALVMARPLLASVRR
jgi:inosine-uridine nucleoside N-ribohydrolase